MPGASGVEIAKKKNKLKKKERRERKFWIERHREIGPGTTEAGAGVTRC